MIADPYLATKDIGERRIIVSHHMRTHLPKGNMNCEWYKKNYRLWHSRAYRVFNESWKNALQYTFTEEEINEKIAKQAEEVKKPVEEYEKTLSDRQRNYIENNVVIEKLFKFLKENNEIE